MAKRPYSMAYRAHGTPRRYLLSGIPPDLWDAARAKAEREGVAMRSLLLRLVTEWLDERGPAVTDRLATEMAREILQDEAFKASLQALVQDAIRQDLPSQDTIP